MKNPHAGWNRVRRAVKRLRRNQAGQDVIEYALLAAVIALAVLVGIKPLAKQVDDAFSQVNAGLHQKTKPAPPQPCELDKTNFCQVEVFFATDRKITGDLAPARYFSGERNEANEPLTFGTVRVSIPSGHKTGNIEEPLPLFTPDVNRDIVVFDLKTAPESQFISSLANAVDTSRNKEALIFIHGYNVDFDEAARRTAQLAWDLQFRGVPILYSWPSKGHFIPYSADEASASWAVDHLKRFLELVSSQSGAQTIHIIAHSMGNRALMYALQQIAIQHSSSVPRFRQIVLAAPDIDAGIFRQLASVFPSVAGHVTVYASEHDKALWFSKVLHQSAATGRQPSLPHPVSGIDIIDASVVSDHFFDFNHSYFAGDVVVLEDMGYVIRAGLPPDQRSLLDPHPATGIPIYWTFRP